MALPPQVPPVGAPSPGSSTIGTGSPCPALIAPTARAVSGVRISSHIVRRNDDGTGVFAAVESARGHCFCETAGDRSHRARRTT